MKFVHTLWIAEKLACIGCIPKAKVQATKDKTTVKS
jgi:hypothetical protein